jgi:hypothetical protein
MSKPFKFRWKLTENYFNAIMVFACALIISHAIMHNDTTMMVLAVVLAIIFPFIGTLIDWKSHQMPKKE